MNRVLIWGFPLVLLGCESIIELELESVDPEIVVTSVFTENVPWQVVIQRTVGLQEEGTHPSMIDDAIVTIEGSDGSFLELTHKGGGFYYSDTSLPQIGVIYTLSVKADGYRNIEASDEIPDQERQPYVRSVKSDQRTAIILYDEAGVENYYAISMLTANVYWQDFSVLNSELDHQVKQYAIQDPFSPYVDRPQVPVVLIHDRSFDGKQYDLLLSIPKIFWTTNLSTYVNSVSKAYYEYYLSSIIQRNAENLSLVEPAPLKSNVQGGQGIFAGYNLYVDGALSPEKIRNQIIGTYDLSSIYTDPVDSTVLSDEIIFTLYSDQSVTGGMKYYSQGDSVFISLEGGFTITDHGSSQYLIQLHHSEDTFFRNAELKINVQPRSNSACLSLTMNQEDKDRDGNDHSIARTFRKRDPQCRKN